MYKLPGFFSHTRTQKNILPNIRNHSYSIYLSNIFIYNVLYLLTRSMLAGCWLWLGQITSIDLSRSQLNCKRFLKRSLLCSYWNFMKTISNCQRTYQSNCTQATLIFRLFANILKLLSSVMVNITLLRSNESLLCMHVWVSMRAYINTYTHIKHRIPKSIFFWKTFEIVIDFEKNIENKFSL